jgi:hypothetical protein
MNKIRCCFGEVGIKKLKKEKETRKMMSLELNLVFTTSDENGKRRGKTHVEKSRINCGMTTPNFETQKKTTRNISDLWGLKKSSKNHRKSAKHPLNLR